MKLNTIFRSLQGEGRYTNVPMTFIRLQGCNFHDHPCAWCDTGYALNLDGGIEYNIPDIIRIVKGFCDTYQSWVCITGGEPMLQFLELRKLVFALKQEQYLIEVETNGSYPPPTWRNRVNSWVVDFKCPSSGNDTSLIMLDSWRLTSVKNQLKFVVASGDDLSIVSSILASRLIIPEVFISPVFVAGKASFLPEAISFCLSHNVRLSLQTHKLIGVE